MTGRRKTGWITWALAAALGTALALPAAGQGPFSPAVAVNDEVITHYELEQRIRFMRLLNQPGDIEAEARKTLIEDRLRRSLARRFGFSLTPEAVQAGMEEFAARGNLTAEQFVAALGQAGVEPQAFRDFVEAGLLWREIIRGKYGPVTTISDADVDRALASFVPKSFLRLNLAEIVISVEGAERDSGLALMRKIRNLAKTPEAFSELASRYSQGPTARSGGVLGWKRLSDLPTKSMEALRGLPPGQVSEPILEGGVARLYLVYESKEEPLKGAAPVLVDFAEFLVPDDGTAAAALQELRRNVDDCDDLYTQARGLPADRLTRSQMEQGKLQADVRAALALMDPGEISAARSRGGWRVLTMLCSRGASPDMQPSRDMVRTQLLNQRLGALAEIFLEELRSEARIRDY